MKNILTLVILLATQLLLAQPSIPDFLKGTWKMENQDIFEHWDQLNNSNLKGFSYKLNNGQMVISEYLDISINQNETIYTATVLNQNQGKRVNFKLTKQDSTFTFENPSHDFPKKIVYQKLNDNEIGVQVSDGAQKGFSYKMHKQFQKSEIKDGTITNPNYDPVLAQKLGADPYGMKSYILVMLKTGTNTSTDQDLISKSFRGHMENINLLVKQGKMIVAGPLGQNDKTYRGIFILNASTFEEAKSLLKNDTAIQEGLLDFELYKWYGSAALAEYLTVSDRIWKIKP